MRLPKQRGALTVETMSAMTVMDKSIKPSAHVKYPTEKGRLRGAGLNLVASRGTWVSLRQEKLEKGGSDSNTETFRRDPAG